MRPAGPIPALALGLALFVPPRHAGARAVPCPVRDTAAAWVRTSRAWSSQAGVRWSNDSLRRVLLAMRDRDQAARTGFGARFGDSLYARQLMTLDSSLAVELGAVLDRHGLPTRNMVGPEGSDAAMLIIQHNWPLQERALALARGVPPDQLSPEKLGMLEDRVLVHGNRPQTFGTQFTAGPDGAFRLAPLADTAGLDARRVAAGMPPLGEYVCLLEEAGMRVDRSSLPPGWRR